MHAAQHGGAHPGLARVTMGHAGEDAHGLGLVFHASNKQGGFKAHGGGRIDGQFRKIGPGITPEPLGGIQHPHRGFADNRGAV